MFDPELGQVREKYRVPLEKGKAIAERIRADLEPLAEALVLVGSIRRRRPAVADVEFVVLPRDVEEFHRTAIAAGFEAGEKRRKYTGVLDGVKVELYIARKREEMGSMVLWYTGDWKFNLALNTKAKRMGYLKNQYGIWKWKRAVLQSPDEREFFDFLGTAWHEPEQRSLAARIELDSMVRDLRRAGERVPTEDRAFVEEAARRLKEEKYLPAAEEVTLKALHEAHVGAKPKPASLGAEELIELGIMAPDGLFDVPEEPLEDPGQLWQRFYEDMTGGSGDVSGLIVRPVGGNVLQIWARVIEEGRPVYYMVYHGGFEEETFTASPEEILTGFLTWATEAGEYTPWMGPYENLPEAM